MEFMADIAAVFHWPPSEMEAMSLGELISWRGKAAARSWKAEDE
jgi:hypothetical protein